MTSSASLTSGPATRPPQVGWLAATLSLLLIGSATRPFTSGQQQYLAQNYTSGAPSAATPAHANSLQQRPNFLETGRQITGILDRFMSLGYDKRVRPNYGGPPVEVNVTMRILSISSVSEVMMDFTADFYFRQTWHDPRLSFKKLGDIQTLYVGAEVSKKIWLPDTFFGNEKMAYFHEATTPNVFLRIDHSGEVYRSIRLTVTSSCPMNLQYFPMDRQRCTIEAESYGYNVKDIIYRWARKDTAVERDKEISLPQFDIVQTVQKYRLEELSSGTYSRLIAEIHFARRMGYYLIQIYIPSSLIVVISWVSFWLHRNASPARVQLGVTTVLTMTTLMSSTNAALPKISYVKSIDIFLGTCFVMVFAALLEYATVGYLGKQIAMRKAQAQHAQSQAQARLFAHLQAQGAQGEPLSQLTALSAPGASSSDHAAAAMAAISPNMLGAAELPASAASQEWHSPLGALLRDNNLPLGASSGQRQRQHARLPAPDLARSNNHNATTCRQHLHSTLGRLDARESSRPCHHHVSNNPLGCPHHEAPAQANQHDCAHHHECRQQDDEPPQAPLRKCNRKLVGTSACSVCDRGGSQTLPRNLTSAQDQQHQRSMDFQAPCCNAQPALVPLQTANLLPAQMTSSVPLLSPSKGASAAAAQAAAAFVNLHRKNQGLPPSTNRNFAPFNSMMNPANSRHLEAIFGIRPSDIDKYSRVVFPVCFVCFQLMYWIVYLHISAFLEPDQHGQQSAPLPTAGPVSPIPT